MCSWSQEAEAERLPYVLNQPELHSETLPKQNKTKPKGKKCVQDVEIETCNPSTGVVEAGG